MEIRIPLCLVALVGLFAALAHPAAADPNCKCRYFGERYDLGTVMCIKGKLSRCEMVLNNTSWKTLADACPQASTPRMRQVDTSAMASAYPGTAPRFVAISR